VYFHNFFHINFYFIISLVSKLNHDVDSVFFIIVYTIRVSIYKQQVWKNQNFGSIFCVFPLTIYFFPCSPYSLFSFCDIARRAFIIDLLQHKTKLMSIFAHRRYFHNTQQIRSLKGFFTEQGKTFHFT